MSALSAPIYLKSFTEALLRRPSRFVVTPKGADASADRLLTFRIHLLWAGFLATSLAVSVVLDHTHAAMRTWAVLGMAIALSPVAVWCAGLAKERRERPLPRQTGPVDGVAPALVAGAVGSTIPRSSMSRTPVTGSPTGGD
jgi:hypothetical protein